ncbi:hypothetical protein EGH24_05950 [Halonotius terrestris]|uniref:Winged helix DNA-binding domain-containing protein n=1 Tax=Halonotius terrestris TaxID=2487750 RepID=A0A8J8PB02_9EURY|nr:hypothetical protein [Halonotius terrestris]TQQ82976.1 hypothetical protein EGH24_05950 [Halonotius terrestris]
MLLKKPEKTRGITKERILRVLLNHTGEDITKYRLSKLAEVSEPWCREYTEKLEEKGLVKDTEVLKPVELYRLWSDIRIEPNRLEVSLQQPMELLKEVDFRYAFTTYQAENLTQGFLFASTTDFYIPPDQIEDWLSVVENKGLLGGGNTRIRVLDDHVFYNEGKVDGYSTVSTPQLILDLLDEGGPCREAAEKLIDSFHGDQKW